MCVQMRRRNDRYVDNFPKTVRKPIPFERKEKVRERIMEGKERDDTGTKTREEWI